MTSSFFGQELHRALREQGPAIRTFQIINAGPLQAVARVNVLEGHSIDVTLTQQGYKTECGETFETVEDLLHSLSPLYGQKRNDALVDALKRLS